MQTFSMKDKEMRGVKPEDPENGPGNLFHQRIIHTNVAELYSVLYITSPSK